MSHHFDLQERLIIVPVRLFGPAGDTIARFALDTGASSTLVNSEVMVLLGYDLAMAPDRIEVTTGSGIEFCVRLPVARLESVGRTLEGFPVLCHTLPPSAQVDGLLGLDFFRGCHLGIDLRNGEITVMT